MRASLGPARSRISQEYRITCLFWATEYRQMVGAYYEGLGAIGAITESSLTPNCCTTYSVVTHEEKTLRGGLFLSSVGLQFSQVGEISSEMA